MWLSEEAGPELGMVLFCFYSFLFLGAHRGSCDTAVKRSAFSSSLNHGTTPPSQLRFPARIHRCTKAVCPGPARSLFTCDTCRAHAAEIRWEADQCGPKPTTVLPGDLRIPGAALPKYLPRSPVFCLLPRKHVPSKGKTVSFTVESKTAIMGLAHEC